MCGKCGKKVVVTVASVRPEVMIFLWPRASFQAIVAVANVFIMGKLNIWLREGSAVLT